MENFTEIHLTEIHLSNGSEVHSPLEIKPRLIKNAKKIFPCSYFHSHKKNQDLCLDAINFLQTIPHRLANPGIIDKMIEHPDLIPSELRNKRIIFPGIIYQCTLHGEMMVRMLAGASWQWHWIGWLSWSPYDENSAAAEENNMHPRYLATL